MDGTAVQHKGKQIPDTLLQKIRVEKAAFSTTASVQNRLFYKKPLLLTVGPRKQTLPVFPGSKHVSEAHYSIVSVEICLLAEELVAFYKDL